MGSLLNLNLLIRIYKWSTFFLVCQLLPYSAAMLESDQTEMLVITIN